MTGDQTPDQREEYIGSRSCTGSPSQHHSLADSCTKLCKPLVRTQWNSKAMEDLCSCLDCTGWDVFMSGANSGHTEGRCCHTSASERTAVCITQGHGVTSPHWTNASKLRFSLRIRYAGPRRSPSRAGDDVDRRVTQAAHCNNIEPIAIFYDRFRQPLPCEHYNSKLLVVIISGCRLFSGRLQHLTSRWAICVYQLVIRFPIQTAQQLGYLLPLHERGPACEGLENDASVCPIRNVQHRQPHPQEYIAGMPYDKMQPNNISWRAMASHTTDTAKTLKRSVISNTKLTLRSASKCFIILCLSCVNNILASM